jgi:tetratricopeptide (TPR) repeat protein
MAKIVLKSYDEINRDRKRLRIILILASLPFLIVIGLFAAKAASMYLNAQSSIDNFEKKDYSASAQSAEKQKVTNFLEQWLAYYNSGTALSAEGKYEKSISELNTALNYTQGVIPNECYVRANLALSYEKYADELKNAGDTLNADKNYWSASNIVEQAPMECFPPSSGGNSDSDETSQTGESMDKTKERSDSKNSENQEEPSDDPSTPGDEPTEEPGEGEAQSDRDKIQEQMDESNADRREDEAADGDSSQQPNSKPW